MANIRLLPPATGNATHKCADRNYPGTAGTPLDVPEHDVPILVANGWIICAAGGVGATAARPLNPRKGAEFSDTTVGAEIIFDGVTWRHAVTGASV